VQNNATLKCKLRGTSKNASAKRKKKQEKERKTERVLVTNRSIEREVASFVRERTLTCSVDSVS